MRQALLLTLALIVAAWVHPFRVAAIAVLLWWLS